MSLNHLARRELFFIAEVHFLVYETAEAVLRCPYQGLGTLNGHKHVFIWSRTRRGQCTLTSSCSVPVGSCWTWLSRVPLVSLPPQVWSTEACFPLSLTAPPVIQDVSEWEQQCGVCLRILSALHQCPSQPRWPAKAGHPLWCYNSSGGSAISGSQGCACSLQQLLPFKNCGPGGCWSYHHFTGRGECPSLLHFTCQCF